jgi:ABC-2 type transport system permease protein
MVNRDAAPSPSPAADPTGPAAIDVAHLVKLYKTTRAVDDVSFRIARGSITGLLGGNGAGKTTTIAMIMGLVLPTSGRIQVLGHPMPEQSADVLGRMNFESPYVDMPMRLTVRQNLTIFGRLYAVENLRARIEQLAADLDLGDFLDRANGKLSAGQKTRVALAKALINQPELLLLDEPTASLDPDTADWVRQRLQDYRKTHAGVAQHARGGAAVRPRHHHEARPHRGRRQPGPDHGPLQPRDAGGSVSGRRARPYRGERIVSGVATHHGISLHRINAMVLRYWYLLMSSWPRMLELIYWPALQIITWGFLQNYISQTSGFFARAGGSLIGAVILWDILFRGQLGFSISFLEEMWARNLGNLMMSPLKPIEFLISLMIMSLIRLAIGVIPMTLLALFVFDFNFYGIGLPLIAFFCNLIFTSWSIGIFVSGLVLRNGLGAESIVWTLMFGLMPLACIYYPVSVLPGWLQYLAWTLPPTYVFEGMRSLLIDHVFRTDLMVDALAINAVLFAASFAIFLALLRSAKRHGSLLGGGE